MKKRIFSWFLTLVMVLGMLPMTALAEEPMEVPYTVETEEQNFVQLLEEEEGTEAGIPFTAAAGDDELTVEESESKYIYTDWNNIEHIVDLYVVTVPFGSNEITLDFGEYSRLAYGYDKAGGYIASYGLGEDGKYEDICEGETTAVVTGSLPDYVQVQTPYIVSEEIWSNELLYAVSFQVDNVLFTSKAGENTLSVVKSDEQYKDPYSDKQVELYIVNAPSDAEMITLNFGSEERLAYGYDKAGGYIASYGSGENGAYANGGKTGETTAVITGELPPYVQVQTPFDENWNSELLYAISFSNSGNSTDPEDPSGEGISVDKLLNNIAKKYADNSDWWQIIGMSAYSTLEGSKYETSAEAKQTFINNAIDRVKENNVEDREYAQAIIACTSLGIDAEQLYPVNSNESFSALDGLKNLSLNYNSDAWYAPYTLAAYNQRKNYDTKDETDSLIEAVLNTQKEDGSWAGRDGDIVQATANMITGLAFYNDEAHPEISDAIVKAIDYLTGEQSEDGSFAEEGKSANTNTVAMTVIGLCAAGVNPDTVKADENGKSALDGLLSFALTDNSGFGNTDNSQFNDYATKQAFCALIAAKQVMKTGKAFNIYDFSHNSDSLTPGRATGSGSETKPDNPPAENDDITVDVTIRPDVGYWMKNKYVTVDEGATVYHAFIKALEGSGITQEGAESGYVSSMTYQGRTLGEFTLGENDGWLYKVNGELPDVGLTSYEIEDGDSILWYYTEDWTKDPDAGGSYREDIEEENQEAADKVNDLIDKIGTITKDSGEAIKAAREAYAALTKEQKELVENYEDLLAAEEAYAALMAEAAELEPIEVHFTDVAEESYYYDAVQWAVANGITAGVAEDTFGPEWTCSRGQLATFLWRMAGSPAPETKTVPYIDVAEDSYYYDAILWAMENDIAKGTDGISFSPEMTVTRAQAVTFLWRALGSPAPSGKESFGDVPETAYYHDAVLWAAENGITSGTGEGMFSPDASCQRGQIVTFLYRAFGK